jgi:uncharacterized protein (DUF924 family)
MSQRPHKPEEVLTFWFPWEFGIDPSIIPRAVGWWFRGGADQAIVERFTPLMEQARTGALDDWSSSARSRLALILVLDQFSRSIYRGTRDAYAQDPKAIALTLEGLENGHYAELKTPWEKTFFMLPLGHSEQLEHLDRAVQLTQVLAEQGPGPLRRFLDHSVSQARGHRDVIARFGRQPHRNAILGRQSTAEEIAYLAAGEFVHQRSLPP